MKTSRLTNTVFALVLTAAFCAGSLQAQDPPAAEKDWSISVDNTFVSKYIWRGQNLSNTASWQPGVTFGYKGLSVSSWSNVAHTAFGDSDVLGNHWTEHDFTVDYGFSLGEKVSLNVGYINYAFPNFTEGRYTNEIYGSVGFDTILQPTFAVYGDMHNGEGMYYNFGIGHSVDLGKAAGLNLSAAVGLNQNQWIEINTVSDVVLGVSVDIPMGEVVTVSPFYNYITGNKSLRTCDGCFYYTGSIAGVSLNFSY
jgi:uncharacterized protein (TIGR02001 family)